MQLTLAEVLWKMVAWTKNKPAIIWSFMVVRLVFGDGWLANDQLGPSNEQLWPARNYLLPFKTLLKNVDGFINREVFVCLSVCLSIYHMRLSVCLSVCLSIICVCLSVSPSVCLSYATVHLSVCPFIICIYYLSSLSILLSYTSKSFSFIHPSIHLSIHLSIRLSVCLSVCLSSFKVPSFSLKPFSPKPSVKALSSQ